MNYVRASSPRCTGAFHYVPRIHDAVSVLGKRAEFKTVLLLPSHLPIQAVRCFNLQTMAESIHTLLSVGAVVSILFLLLELCLLPLFDLVREKFSIVTVRRIIKGGNRVVLKEEQSILSWFGLADGIASHSKSLALSRFLKVIIKVIIVACPFFFEFEIDTDTLATPIRLFFPSRLKPLSEIVREKESWFVSPVPFEGLAEDQLLGLVPFGKTEASVSSRNYNVSCLPGFDLDYIAHCTARVNDRQEVYAGVITIHNETNSSSSLSNTLSCLNGTGGRPKVVIMSYDPDSSRVSSSNASSISLFREIATDNVSRMYESRVTMSDDAVLEGFIVVTMGTHKIKDVYWSMYGLLLDTRTNNIVRLNIPLKLYHERGKLCSGTSFLGVWQRNGDLTNCPDGRPAGLLSSTLHVLQMNQKVRNVSYADIQDIGLRLGASTDLVSIGQPFNILRAAIAEIPFYEYQAPHRFTEDIRERIASEVFYYSPGRKNQADLRLGIPQQYTTLSRPMTIMLFTAIIILLTYSMASISAELRSRVACQTKSECFTRDSLLSILCGRNQGKSVAIGLIAAEDSRNLVKVVSAQDIILE